MIFGFLSSRNFKCAQRNSLIFMESQETAVNFTDSFDVFRSAILYENLIPIYSCFISTLSCLIVGF